MKNFWILVTLSLLTASCNPYKNLLLGNSKDFTPKEASIHNIDKEPKLEIDDEIIILEEQTIFENFEETPSVPTDAIKKISEKKTFPFVETKNFFKSKNVKVEDGNFEKKSVKVFKQKYWWWIYTVGNILISLAILPIFLYFDFFLFLYPPVVITLFFFPLFYSITIQLLPFLRRNTDGTLGFWKIVGRSVFFILCLLTTVYLSFMITAFALVIVLLLIS